MIGRLNGILLEKNPPQLLIDCHGVGYEVDVPMGTFYNLPPVGESVVLFTHFVVREDAQLLFGFGSLDERALFRQLIRISGIGARMALAILSGMSVAELSHAVAQQEVARLVKVPGIGKKTAERLLLELKGKLGEDIADLSHPSAQSDSSTDILHALISLGYSEKEAKLTLKQVPADASVSDGIKFALKALSKV